MSGVIKKQITIHWDHGSLRLTPGADDLGLVSVQYKNCDAEEEDYSEVMLLCIEDLDDIVEAIKGYK